MIYIIHFDEKLAHTQHYIGFCRDGTAKRRLKKHKSGEGARILARLNELGIGYKIVNTLPGDRDEERRLKKQKNHKRYCPICNPKTNGSHAIIL